jgi:hypothetical protein
MGSKVAALGCLAIAAGWTIGCSGKTGTTTAPSAGIYTLSGRVEEAGYFPVRDARVEIIGGPMSGKVAITDSAGYYIFNGVAGALQVRATKDGYLPATRAVSSDTEHVNLVLTYDATPSVIGDVYRLTFTPGPSCQLPDDARRRTYNATISGGRDNRAIVTLTGAQFWTDGYCGLMNSFDALVHGSTVSLSNYGGDCGVLEELANMRYLSLWGTADATLTDSISVSAFVGTVAVVTWPNDTHPIATCTASDHQLVFERIVAPSRR